MSLRRKLFNRITRTEKSGIINVLIKPISMIVTLLYTPLLLSFLGNEMYGVWITLLGIINWINYFDFGIGNGLRNQLATEISEKKFSAARQSITTSYVVVAGISLILFIILTILTFSLDLGKVFSTNLNLRPVFIISFLFICANFVLSITNIIYYSLQISELVSIRICLIQVFNLIGVFLLKLFFNPSLIIIAILFGATTFVIYAANFIAIYLKYKELRPALHSIYLPKVGNVCHTGLKFFFIQIFCLMLFTVDNLLISHYFGPEAVTPFSISNKYFNTAYTFFATFLIPYWSRCSVAFAQNDLVWLKTTIKRIGILCSIFIFFNLILYFLFKPLVRIWIGSELDYQFGLNIVMCIFYCLLSLTSFETQFINGSGKIDIQLAVYAIIGIMNIPLSIILGVHFRYGVMGIRLATTILLAFAVIVFGFNLHYILSKIRPIPNS